MGEAGPINTKKKKQKEKIYANVEYKLQRT
jgi:hypothetical protein